MSYFVFGSIAFGENRDDEKLDDKAWRIVRRGIKNNIFVLVTPNIPQKIVHEMIDEQEADVKSDIRFLITASPMCDTTHSLISPPYLGEEGLKIVYKNLALISKWVNEMFKYDGVARMSLYLTEGYDDSFKKSKIKAKDLYAALHNEVDEYGDIPSLALEIVKIYRAGGKGGTLWGGPGGHPIFPLSR